MQLIAIHFQAGVLIQPRNVSASNRTLTETHVSQSTPELLLITAMENENNDKDGES